MTHLLNGMALRRVGRMEPAPCAASRRVYSAASARFFNAQAEPLPHVDERFREAVDQGVANGRATA